MQNSTKLVVTQSDEDTLISLSLLYARAKLVNKTLGNRGAFTHVVSTDSLLAGEKQKLSNLASAIISSSR